jgi:hypothetical protein
MQLGMEAKAGILRANKATSYRLERYGPAQLFHGLACQVITGTMSTTPTATMEALLNLDHIQLRMETKADILRANKATSYRHWNPMAQILLNDKRERVLALHIYGDNIQVISDSL